MANATQTSQPDASIDLAFLFGFVHAVDETFHAVLLELSRVLKESGILAIKKTPWVREEPFVEVMEEQGFSFSKRVRRVFVFLNSGN